MFYQSLLALTVTCAIPAHAQYWGDSKMPNGKAETIRHLKNLFWETMAKAEALRNIAATQRSEATATQFLERAQAEEDKAKRYLAEAERLEQSDTG